MWSCTNLGVEHRCVYVMLYARDKLDRKERAEVKSGVILNMG